jgi:hypothetical protein
MNTLSRSGWSQRRVARELGIDRETVARYRELARQSEEPKPAISPAGSEAVPEAKPAISPIGSEPATNSVSDANWLDVVIVCGLSGHELEKSATDNKCPPGITVRR